MSELSFSQILRLLRTRACWSQMQMGFVLGIKSDHVSRLERGVSGPSSAEQATEWAERIGCDVAPFVDAAMRQRRTIDRKAAGKSQGGTKTKK